MYPLFQHAALKVHLADQARVGRARGPRSDPVGMPREVIQGSALLLEGSLSGQWSPKWRFSGGGVEWVVRCTVRWMSCLCWCAICMCGHLHLFKTYSAACLTTMAITWSCVMRVGFGCILAARDWQKTHHHRHFLCAANAKKADCALIEMMMMIAIVFYTLL